MCTLESEKGKKEAKAAVGPGTSSQRVPQASTQKQHRKNTHHLGIRKQGPEPALERLGLKDVPGSTNPRMKTTFCEALAFEDGVEQDCGQLCGRISSKSKASQLGKRRAQDSIR